MKKSGIVFFLACQKKRRTKDGGRDSAEKVTDVGVERGLAKVAGVKRWAFFDEDATESHSVEVEAIVAPPSETLGPEKDTSENST